MDTKPLVNGVAVEELGEKVEAFKQQPDLAAFKFRVTHTWIDAGRNNTKVESFHGAGEDHAHATSFTVPCDEPALLLGSDEAPNPIEYLLTALASCLTSSIAYHAAARGIRVEEIEATLEGDIDLRGYLGIDEAVRKGCHDVHVTYRVKSDAPLEVLEECASFSPVLDTFRNGVNVDLAIEKA